MYFKVSVSSLKMYEIIYSFILYVLCSGESIWQFNQCQLMLGPPWPYIVGQCFGHAISLQIIPLYLIVLLVSDLRILKLLIAGNINQ